MVSANDLKADGAWKVKDDAKGAINRNRNKKSLDLKTKRLVLNRKIMPKINSGSSIR